MSKPAESCQSCKFWKRFNAISGECRRFPPTAITRTRDGDTSGVNFCFPEMDHYDWCGEYVKGKVGP